MRYYAIHMRNKKTGEKRIQKVKSETIEEATAKGNCGYGTDWEWTGTEPWWNVDGRVIKIYKGFYNFNEVF